MGSQPVATRAVFDTNVVISALVFRAGRLSWLLPAWRTGELIPVVSRATVGELLKVLGYPKFQLARDEIDELLADYLPFAEAWPGPVMSSGIPLADPDDAMFVDLALTAKVQLLVSGDGHLGSMGKVANLRVVTPEELRKSRERL